MKYRRKPEIVEAVQWWKNGDHSDAFRYNYFGSDDLLHRCAECKSLMREHGVLGKIICPGMWIISYRGRSEILNEKEFNAQFEPVGE